RIHRLGVEEVVADLELAIQQHRHLVAPLLLERRVCVDVHHLEGEVVAALEYLQRRDQVLAEAAVLAREDGELGPHSPSGRNVTKRVPLSSRSSSATGFLVSRPAT